MSNQNTTYKFTQVPKIESIQDAKSKNIKNLFIIIGEQSYADIKENKKTLDITSKSNQSLIEIFNCYNFKGKLKSFAVTQEDNFNRIIFIGAGNMLEYFNTEDYEKSIKQYIQEVGGYIADIAEQFKISEIHINAQNVSLPITQNFGHDRASLYFAYGAAQKAYTFDRYFTKKSYVDNKVKISQVNFIINEESTEMKEELIKINNEIESIYNVRDLVNEPSNQINPESLAEIFKETFSGQENVKINILDEKEITKLEMNTLLAVGRASKYESRVVVIEYKGNESSDVIDMCLIGKGVTFDSGGLSIKPASAMEDMKGDMAGSATVFGSMKTLIKSGVKKNVVGIVGLVENMVSGDSLRPGDVIKTMSGQTVEVLNTDAEGRLVLCDLIHYGSTKYSPSYMIDFATLTGAILVALGTEYAGLFSNSNKISNIISTSGESTGDLCHRMPMSSEYDKLINSSIADIKNIQTGRWAGSTTAAHFLKRFVKKGIHWAHIDIAGVSDLDQNGYTSKKGATGFGVKLVNDIINKI